MNYESFSVRLISPHAATTSEGPPTEELALSEKLCPAAASGG